MWFKEAHGCVSSIHLVTLFLHSTISFHEIQSLWNIKNHNLVTSTLWPLPERLNWIAVIEPLTAPHLEIFKGLRWHNKVHMNPFDKWFSHCNINSMWIYFCSTNYVHGTTAVWSCHAKNVAVIWWPNMELQLGGIPIEFEFWWKHHQYTRSHVH